MKRFTTCAAGLAIMATAAFSATITNGDFEAGNTGFSTGPDYNFVGPAGSMAMYPEGSYTVTNTGQTSNSFHDQWFPGVGPRQGVRMALYNGVVCSCDEWIGEATGLVIGRTYTVSGWGASVYAVNPANLQWLVGNAAIGPTVVLSSNIGEWQQFFGAFIATDTTQALIIRSTQTAAFGNDFALDELTISDVPEPGTYALFAAGLVGLAAIRRLR